MGSRGVVQVTGWLLMLTLPVGVVSAEAQGSKPKLQNLAKELNLTSAGLPAWLQRLGVSADRPASEQLLAVTRDNRTMGTRTGSEQHVPLGVDLDLVLLTAGAGIVLVHNHPGSTGFSADDLLQLAKPGVAVVVAIGHDGSLYMAAAGPRYDRNLFEEIQYGAARKEIDRKLSEDMSRALPARIIDAHRAHLVSLSLKKAGVILYEARLAPDRRASFDQARQAFGPVIVAGAGRVPRNLAQKHHG
jgi:hypothetical protein